MGGLQILWIDDQDQWTKQYALALEDEGHSVTRIAHANPALDVLESGQQFDVVIIDLWLPAGEGNVERRAIDSASQLEMGLEILRYAESRDLDMPPVIALTGVYTEEKRDALLAYTPTVMKKPPDLDDFIKAVENAGNGRSNAT